MQSRMPVNMIPGNADLLKSQGVTPLVGGMQTDMGTPESVPSETMRSQFRAPADRINGNVVFRRNPDGQLDYDDAVSIVMEVVNRIKNSRGVDPLTNQDHAILCCVFPPVFGPEVDLSLISSIRSVNLRVTDLECMVIAMKVAGTLSEIMNYNGGQGGGSVPGRNETRA